MYVDGWNVRAGQVKRQAMNAYIHYASYTFLCMCVYVYTHVSTHTFFPCYRPPTSTL